MPSVTCPWVTCTSSPSPACRCVALTPHLSRRVWKAASSKADPRQQQDWILKCLHGWVSPSSRRLWGGDTLLLSTRAAGSRNPKPDEARGIRR